MAWYRQNAANGIPRGGIAPMRNHYPRSAPIYDAQMLAPSEENPSSTAPGGGYRAFPLGVGVVPSFGSWDGLGGRLMAVSQADTYDTSANPWPAAGTYEEPGAATAVLQMIRLQPTTSAHPGLAMATGAGPNMLFVAPPVFGYQTQPIYAVGL